MIEDKELGLKVAENEDEALWVRVKEAQEASLKQLRESMKVQRIFKRAAEEELRRLKGGRASKKNDKTDNNNKQL